MLTIVKNVSIAQQFIEQAKEGIQIVLNTDHPRTPTPFDLIESLEVLLLKIKDTEQHIGLVKHCDIKGNSLHEGFDFRSDILGEMKELYFFNPHKTSLTPSYSVIIKQIITPILDRLNLMSHAAAIIVAEPLIHSLIAYTTDCTANPTI